MQGHNIREEFSGPHILVEGNDLTGKDTVGGHLQTKLGYKETRHLSLSTNNPFDALANSLTKEQMVFAGSVIARAILHDIRYGHRNQPTLMVSGHPLRAVAFQEAAKEPLADLFVDLLKYCPQHHVAILLTASLSARQQRAKTRSEKLSDHDKMIFTKPERVLLMDSVLARHAVEFFGAEVIDTTEMTIEEVSEKALSVVQRTTSTGSSFRRVQKYLNGDGQYFEKELNRFDSFMAKRHKVTL